MTNNELYYSNWEKVFTFNFPLKNVFFYTLTSYSLSFACQSVWSGSRPTRRSSLLSPSLNVHWTLHACSSVRESPSKNMVSTWTSSSFGQVMEGTYFFRFCIISRAISPETFEFRGVNPRQH